MQSIEGQLNTSEQRLSSLQSSVEQLARDFQVSGLELGVQCNLLPVQAAQGRQSGLRSCFGMCWSRMEASLHGQRDTHIEKQDLEVKPV